MSIEASRLRAGEDSGEDFLVVAAVAAGESEGAALSSFGGGTAAAGGAGFSDDSGAGFCSALDSPARSAVPGAALCCASAAASSFGSSAAGAGDSSRCVRVQVHVHVGGGDGGGRVGRLGRRAAARERLGRDEPLFAGAAGAPANSGTANLPLPNSDCRFRPTSCCGEMSGGSGSEAPGSGSRGA